MKKFFAVLALTIGIVSTLSFVQPASAALFDASKGETCKGANVSNDSDCKSAEAGTTVSNTVKNIINLLSAIVGIVAVIMIIVNGFRLITSNGDSSTITAARNGIVYAVVGLVVVALSQFIVRFVISKV